MNLWGSIKDEYKRVWLKRRKIKEACRHLSILKCHKLLNLCCYNQTSRWYRVVQYGSLTGHTQFGHCEWLRWSSVSTALSQKILRLPQPLRAHCHLFWIQVVPETSAASLLCGKLLEREKYNTAILMLKWRQNSLLLSLSSASHFTTSLENVRRR
jgi:hypothetical protein